MTAFVGRSEEKPDRIGIVNGGDDKDDRVVESFVSSYMLDVVLRVGASRVCQSGSMQRRTTEKSRGLTSF